LGKFSKELIGRKIEVCSPKAGYQLFEDESTEIVQEVTGYFRALNDIAISFAKETSKKLIEEGKFMRIRETES